MFVETRDAMVPTIKYSIPFFKSKPTGILDYFVEGLHPSRYKSGTVRAQTRTPPRPVGCQPTTLKVRRVPSSSHHPVLHAYERRFLQ